MYNPTAKCYDGTFRIIPETEHFVPAAEVVKANDVMKSYRDRLVDLAINGELRRGDYEDISLSFLSMYFTYKVSGNEIDAELKADAENDITKLSSNIAKLGRVAGEKYMTEIVKYVLPAFAA